MSGPVSSPAARSNPLDRPAPDAGCPDFADECRLPFAPFWLVLLGGALAAALGFGLGLVIVAVLA